MRYALLQNGYVRNIIELNPKNEADFPNVVPMPEDTAIGAGDTYQEGVFYRNGERVLTNAEILALMELEAAEEPTEEP